jgi:hypothetical protein
MYENGVLISKLISELENLKIEYGDIEVVLPQTIDEKDGSETDYNAHVSIVEVDENDLGEAVVKIY